MHLCLPIRVASALTLISVIGACHVEAHVKGAEAEADSEETMTVSAPPRAAATPAATPRETAAIVVTPSTSACPLTCFEARGSERANVTAEEQTQLRTALEPVVSRMRGCSSAEEWSRYGSPVINLRIAPDGTLADLGVDPHHRRESSCFDDAGRGASVSLALPGRTVVRCAERCVDPTQRARARGRRTR
jgi:hypothetical protein